MNGDVEDENLHHWETLLRDFVRAALMSLSVHDRARFIRECTRAHSDALLELQIHGSGELWSFSA